MSNYREHNLIDCRVSREKINIFVAFRVQYMRTFPFGEHHRNGMVAARSEMLRAEQEFRTRRSGNGIILIERMTSQANI
jgi:hypothetical protein